jgi:DNA-binding NarL/FixJ family response regulator
MQALRRDHPGAVVLVLTTYDGDEDIFRAVEAGARGYLFKGEFREALLEAIRAVHAGETFLPPEIASRVAARAEELPITARELEILTLVAKGLSNPEIGQVLSIAEMTVKNHLRKVFQKLDATDRTEAVTVAIRRGLLRPE